MNKCKKCGHKLLAGTVFIETIRPIDEPYESGEHINIDDICLAEQFLVHYCEQCRILHDIWDDEQVHLI
jgi:hypothetical protein